MSEMSILQKLRLEYEPVVPKILRQLGRVRLKSGTGRSRAPENLRSLFPKSFEQPPLELSEGEGSGRSLCIGAVFSGGQAAGGHNVLAGIWDALQEFGSNSRLVGFLDGPSGIVEGKRRELTAREIDSVRNLGGFDLIGSGRTKIETPEQMEASLKTCEALQLDGLVVIGGDDSNTNAAVLAEFFLARGCKTRVLGVPKTIDGDLRSVEIEISFGFDSAAKTYAELIGNIARDALSAKKYYHFIKLMGRSASHIALECALATHPNLAFIGEEGRGLSETVKAIADLVCRRKAAGKEYGVVLIPEGLVEFFPEMKSLIQELNGGRGVEGLSDSNRKFFAALPETIQKQLLLERDPHGNIAVSQIETEQLLMALVKQELKGRGGYKGKFLAQEHFFGYEGRACLPTNFDANYCYALGRLAAIGVRDGATGMICAVQNLKRPPEEWRAKLVPIVQMMRMEVRKGKEKPVVEKALVDLRGKAFAHFSQARTSWEIEDHYRYPGPIQFFGARELTDSIPLSMTL
jgi:pyrophosphate--fructose-6-phosphate 1-phosphotransferase